MLRTRSCVVRWQQARRGDGVGDRSGVGNGADLDVAARGEFHCRGTHRRRARQGFELRAVIIPPGSRTRANAPSAA